MADRVSYVEQADGPDQESSWGPNAPTSVIRSEGLPAEVDRSIDAEMSSLSRAMKEAC